MQGQEIEHSGIRPICVESAELPRRHHGIDP